MHSLEDIVREIASVSGLSAEEVKQKIKDKQTELSGLVSPEGAAYIVGKELGVNLLKETKRRLKIKNIVSGMRSVELIGRVVNISERRDFEKGGRSGSVVNIVLGDETGTVRLSLWDDEIKLLDVLGLKENDIVKVSNAYVKVDSRGNHELRLGRFGKIEKTEGEKLPEKEGIEKSFEVVKVRDIADLEVGEYSEIKASLVQIFRRNPFFEVCPECEGRVERSGNGWICKEHGKIEPKRQLVISGVVDDGTGNVRVVFFRELAEKVLGKSIDELKGAEGVDDPLSIYEGLDVLGKEFIIRGRLKKNQFTERMEFVANEVEEVNVNKEAEKLIEKIESVKD